MPVLVRFGDRILNVDHLIDARYVGGFSNESDPSVLTLTTTELCDIDGVAVSRDLHLTGRVADAMWTWLVGMSEWAIVP